MAVPHFAYNKTKIKYFFCFVLFSHLKRPDRFIVAWWRTLTLVWFDFYACGNGHPNGNKKKPTKKYDHDLCLCATQDFAVMEGSVCVQRHWLSEGSPNLELLLLFFFLIDTKIGVASVALTSISIFVAPQCSYLLVCSTRWFDNGLGFLFFAVILGFSLLAAVQWTRWSSTKSNITSLAHVEHVISTFLTKFFFFLGQQPFALWVRMSKPVGPASQTSLRATSSLRHLGLMKKKKSNVFFLFLFCIGLKNEKKIFFFICSRLNEKNFFKYISCLSSHMARKIETRSLQRWDISEPEIRSQRPASSVSFFFETLWCYKAASRCPFGTHCPPLTGRVHTGPRLHGHSYAYPCPPDRLSAKGGSARQVGRRAAVLWPSSFGLAGSKIMLLCSNFYANKLPKNRCVFSRDTINQ